MVTCDFFAAPVLRRVLQNIFITIAIIACFGHGESAKGATIKDNGDEEWVAVSRTPYERYMENVRSTLAQLGTEKPTMEQVKEWMRIGYSFRYESRTLYTPHQPRRTESARAGDCKDKTLWLAEKMNDSNVRFVIGRARRNAPDNHAWLVWSREDGDWILDCTKTTEPILLAKGSDRFVPLFSYTVDGTFSHVGVNLERAKLPRIASEKQSIANRLMIGLGLGAKRGLK